MGGRRAPAAADAPAAEEKKDGGGNSNNMSDSRRQTIKHVNNVKEEINSLEEPKANARIIAIVKSILEPTHLRFCEIEDKSRRAFINTRIDDLMGIPLFKSIVTCLVTDPQGGCVKEDVPWIRTAVHCVLHEVRAIRVNLDIASSNIPLEPWDQIVAKSMASETLIDEKGLKTIAEGASFSWGTRHIEGTKHVAGEINMKNINQTTPADIDKKEVKTIDKKEVKTEEKTLPLPTARQTPGARCTYYRCLKMGHTEAQCYLKEKDLQNKADKDRKRERSRDRRSSSRDRRTSPRRNKDSGRRRSHSR